MGKEHQRGTILVVVLFLASAIAALAAISSGRVVTETRQQQTLERETRAYNDAYAQLQLALNVVNTSAYNDENQNLELLEAITGKHGGTVAGEDPPVEAWLHDPEGVLHGKIEGTDVRVYRAKDYIKRLAVLKGDDVVDVDPDDLSHSYYVIEATGRSANMIRVVSALIRENEPFSSFVFFQNRHPLGVSGAPRGLIHANDTLEFYFPNGNYVDSVSAVNGFDYVAGATQTNTNIATGNPEAPPINLEQVDFPDLQGKSSFFTGTAGLDAEIRFYGDGRVRVRQYTPPRYEMVEKSWTGDVLVGYTTQTVTQTQQVQVGTTQEERTRQVPVYTTQTYYVDVPVYETQQVTRTRQDPVYEYQQVEKTKQVPIYEKQTQTCTRQVRVFVPYDTDAGGGTAVGGGGDGVPGEYQWVTEEYSCQVDVLVGYETQTYYVTQKVQVGTTTVTWTENVQVQVGTTQEQRTRQVVDHYETETYYVTVPVYESQEVQVEQSVPVYETTTYTWTEQQYFAPEFVDETYLTLGDTANTMYIDGRITRLEGDLNGRLTIVGNEKVRITGDIRYVDGEGDPAMLNGDDYTQPYTRNTDYNGKSVLGVIARDDVVFTRSMPSQAEVNATLLSAFGRIGIDGFQIDENGVPVKDVYYGLTAEEKLKEQAYDQTSYRSRTFTKDSLRRLGGIVSNDRILETYIKARRDGTSTVDSGFKRGSMRFDFNLLFNPPPNFVNVPRPVVTSIAPVYFVRNGDE